MYSGLNRPFPSPANLQLTSSDNDGGDVDNDGGNVDSAALSYGRAAIQQLEQVKRAPFFCKIVFQYFCRLSRRCQSFTKNSLSILVKEAFLSYYKA